ncbi:MAG: DNA mismatch repair protein MutS, partial [Clostridiales Family XIII bacterium]|nr:DNA mismatch repair protein MutS [Clostridiales Family XIII bacterium]
MTNKLAEQQISFIEDLGAQGRARLTPMMRQYLEIKDAHQDCILFFRLGDFYEMFFDDALEASKALEITLTKKNCGIDGNRAPMCGVPFQSAETYIARLVEKGYKVAICEQTEDPLLAKGLVNREVVRIVTPGTLTGDLMLKAEENNYLASVFVGKSDIGLAWTDISTGDLFTAELRVSDIDTLMNELTRISPSEVLFFEETPGSEIGTMIDENMDLPKTELPASEYTQETGLRLLRQVMKIENPKSLGLESDSCSLAALFGLVSYLEKTQKQQLGHMKPLLAYNFTDHMRLDRASIRNLELTESILGKDTEGSLLGVLDKTHTAMGGRLLKKWIKEPLTHTDRIQERLFAVEFLYEEVLIRNNLKTHLKAIYDLERLVFRVSCGNANGRDLIALKNSVSVLPEIKNDLLVADDCLLLQELNEKIADLEEIRSLIEAAIEDEPPFTVREGGLIKAGYSQELDDLKSSIASGQEWIANLE